MKDFLVKYGITILSILFTGASLIVAWIKSKKTGNTKGMLALVERIPILVITAESLFGSGKGTAKLDYVLTQLRLNALQNNIKVNVEDLTAQINSVVESTNNVNVNKDTIPSETNKDGASIETITNDTKDTLTI